MRNVNAIRKIKLRVEVGRQAVEFFRLSRIVAAAAAGEPVFYDSSSSNTDSELGDDGEKLSVLTLGVACVWRECQILCQNLERLHNASDRNSLNRFHVAFKTALDSECLNALQCILEQLQKLYLQLQGSLLLNTVTIGSQQRMELQRLMNWHGTNLGMITSVHEFNRILKKKFTIEQRQNIDDFLQYISKYLQPQFRQQMNVDDWLVCSQGLVSVWLSYRRVRRH